MATCPRLLEIILWRNGDRSSPSLSIIGWRLRPKLHPEKCSCLDPNLKKLALVATRESTTEVSRQRDDKGEFLRFQAVYSRIQQYNPRYPEIQISPSWRNGEITRLTTDKHRILVLGRERGKGSGDRKRAGHLGREAVCSVFRLT